MASRQVRHKRKQRSRYRLGFWLVLLVAVLLALWGRRPQVRSNTTGLSTEGGKTAIGIKFQDEVTRILVDTPESQLIPMIVRQKVMSLVQMNKTKQLHFLVSPQTVSSQYALMSCACSKDALALFNIDKPGILIYPKIMEFTNTQTKIQSMTTFALTLYHESLHLDNWPLPTNPTTEQRLVEEARVYSRTNIDAVRPMIDAGLWVDDSLREINDVLRFCGDDANCPEFTNLMQMYDDAARKKPAPI